MLRNSECTFAAPSQHVAARLQHAYSPSEWWGPKISIFMSNISKDLNHCKFWTAKSQYSESYRTCKLDRRSRERAVNGLRLPFKGPLPVGDSTFPENLQSDVKYTNYTPQTQLLTSVVILSVCVSFRMYKNPVQRMIEYPKPWNRMVKSLEIQLWTPIFSVFFLRSIFSTLTVYPRVWKTSETNVSRRVESL